MEASKPIVWLLLVTLSESRCSDRYTSSCRLSTPARRPSELK
jgi:hypothetical protein